MTLLLIMFYEKAVHFPLIQETLLLATLTLKPIDLREQNSLTAGKCICV